MSNLPRIELVLDPEDNKTTLPSVSSQHKHTQLGIGRWISYMNSAEYKRIQPADAFISESDLAEHNKPDDLWMALNQGGKRAVFDITSFARFHPGGLDILMEYAGADASEAFRTAHAYVNVDMIGNLRKGFLKRDKPGTGRGRNHLLPSMVVPRLSRNEPARPKWDWTVKNSASGVIELVIRFPRFPTIDHAFSWMDTLRTVAFWQPPTADPGGQPNASKRGRLLVRTLLGESYHRIEFHLLPTLVPHLPTLRSQPGGPPSSCNSAQAHVTIELRQQVDASVPPKPVSTIGSVISDSMIPVSTETDINLNQLFLNCTVAETRQLPGTPYRFIRISWSPETAWMPVPLGHHVFLRVLDGSGQPICRPYTPIWHRMKSDMTDQQFGSAMCTELSFLIKIYPDGVMSQLLDKLKPGDPIETSLPMGQVSYDFLRLAIRPSVQSELETGSESVHTVFMLAAGSGITPMLRLLSPILGSGTEPRSAVDHSEPVPVLTQPRVCLVCFDRTETDQVLLDELSDLQSCYPNRFRVRRFLSDPSGKPPAEGSSSWIRGRISESLCRECLLAETSNNGTDLEVGANALWLICGPRGFNEAASNIARQWHVPESHIVVFHG